MIFLFYFSTWKEIVQVTRKEIVAVTESSRCFPDETSITWVVVAVVAVVDIRIHNPVVDVEVAAEIVVEVAWFFHNLACLRTSLEDRMLVAWVCKLAAARNLE